MAESLTKSMRVDILSALKERTLTDAVPELKRVKSFIEYIKNPIQGLEYKETMAYIVLLYSKDSILNKEPMPPLEERQAKAAELVGFTRSKDGDFSKTVKEILFPLAEERLMRMMFEWILLQNSSLWEEIVMAERLSWSYLKNISEMMKHDDPKKVVDALEKQKKLQEHVLALRKSLEEMYKEMFSDNQEAKEYARGQMLMTTIERSPSACVDPGVPIERETWRFRPGETTPRNDPFPTFPAWFDGFAALYSGAPLSLYPMMFPHCVGETTSERANPSDAP